MREAAFSDEILTTTELPELKRAAKALGVPTYFDDLAPTGASARSKDATPRHSGTSAAGRKCGHCGEAGHYRPTCPVLVAGA